MNDLISRQAAIDAIDDWWINVDDNRHPVDVIKALPSAQPEIVRCVDCKWWDKKDDAPCGYCMAMKHGFVSSHWEIGIYRTYKGDFFCADGERKDDGKNREDDL